MDDMEEGVVNAVAPDWNLKNVARLRLNSDKSNAVAPDWNLKEERKRIASKAGKNAVAPDWNLKNMKTFLEIMLTDKMQSHQIGI